MSRYDFMGNMITTREAALILGRTAHTLALWRRDEYGPQPVTMIGRSFLYNREEVEGFAEKLKAVQRGDGKKTKRAP